MLAKISAYDPTFRNCDDAIILAWASALTLANVAEDVALEAVDLMYVTVDNPNFRPLPGMLINHCRDIRRRDFDVRQQTKAEEEELAGPEKITLEQWEQRHGEKFPKLNLGKDIPSEVNPLRVPCPQCKASAGAPCIVVGTARQLLRHARAHPSRIQIAEGKCVPWLKRHVDPHSDDCYEHAGINR